MAHTNPYRPPEVADAQAQLAMRVFERARFPSFGSAPSASIGLTAIPGSSPAFMRSDAAPALSQAISPTWTGNHTFAPASGNTLISTGRFGIRSATPTGVLTVITDNAGDGASNSAWDNKYAVVSPNGESASGAAVALGYDTTNDRANLVAVAPGSPATWKPLHIFCGGFNIKSSNGVSAVQGDTAGNVGIGVAPFSTTKLQVHLGTNQNIATLVQSSNASLTALADAGTVNTLRLIGNPLQLVGDGANTGAILTTSNQLALQVAGTGISIKEGSNCKQGKSTMVAGVVTVSTTAVTSSSRIFISINDAGSGALTNIGSIYVNNIVAGTSFDIRSTNVLDTSSVVWLITEPS